MKSKLSFKEAYLENENVFSFTREDDKNLLLIVCNMHSYPTDIYLSSQGEVLLHNYEICTILSRILGSWIRASSMDCLHLFEGLLYGYEVITSS